MGLDMKAVVTDKSEDMDMSDGDSDSPGCKKMKLDEEWEANSLKDENDSLRCQLEAYKNEIYIVRSELQAEIDKKSRELEEMKRNDEQQRRNASAAFAACNSDETARGISVSDRGNDVFDESMHSYNLLEKEARIIGLASMFLQIHPVGTGVDSLYTFLKTCYETSELPTVEDLEAALSKYPSLFRRNIVFETGSKIQCRWRFVGLSHVENN